MKKNRFISILILLIALLSPIFQYFGGKINLNNSKEINQNLGMSSQSGGGYIINTTAEYSWIEISNTGTILPGVSDNSWAFNYINFPSWNFTFYETNYDRIEVGSNGWMGFSPTSARSSPGKIPDYIDQNIDCVALLWNEFQPSESSGGGGTVFYQFLSSPNRLIIEYHEMYTSGWYGPSEYAGTFEIIFYESGDIKFQYKDILNLTRDLSVVGLDHGDMLNYNLYTEIKTENLPIYSKAIEFTFDKMISVNYTINHGASDEISWIVERINNEKMDTFFGLNWENKFGMLPNPQRGEKMKIKISNIEENDTSLEIDYEIWDWIYRLNQFSISSNGIDSLNYLKNTTLNIPNYTLPNFYPLILPAPTFLYLRYSDISSIYSGASYNSYYEETTLSLHQSKLIEGHDLNVNGNGKYNNNGTLRSLYFSMYNVTQGRYEVILELTLLKPEHIINFSLNINENEEHSWIVTKINQDAMDLFLGDNWEFKLGLIPDPIRTQKMKVNISSIAQNISHWEVTYDIWNWTDRPEDFSPNSDNINNIQLRIDPFNYTNLHVFKNLFPLFVPAPPEQYIRFGNLDHNTYNIFVDPTMNIYNPVLVYSDHNFHGRAYYNSEGILEKIQFKHNTYPQAETIFEMEYLTSKFLLNGSIQLKLNEERSWLLAKVNETVMESFLGNNWESNFGLPQISNNLDKVKINITSILDNSTHLKINYSIWDGINLYDTFNSTPSSFEYIDFDKNPFYNKLPYNTTCLFPLIMPYPPDLYWKYGINNETAYQEIQYIPNLNITTINFQISNYLGYLWGTVVYNNLGVLSEISVFFDEAVSMTQYPVLNLIELHEGVKPNYIGSNVGDVYEYDIFKYDIDSYLVPPDLPVYKKARMEVKYISDEDPEFDRVLLLANTTYLNELDNWIKLTDSEASYYRTFLPFTDINLIQKNLSTVFSYPLLRSFPILISSEVNWPEFYNVLENYLLSSGSPSNIGIERLSNGFIVRQEISGDELETLYLYTDDGVLNKTSLSLNGEEFYICQLISITKDVTAPNIMINSPQNNSEYDNIAPLFNLTIIEDNLDTIWYTLDGGLINISCSTLGQINQNVWNIQSEGEILIVFYAKDIAGNIGMKEVIVIKRVPPNSEIPGYNIFWLLGVISVVSIALIKIQKRKKK